MDSLQPRTRVQTLQQTSKLMRQMINALRTRMDDELKPRRCTLSQLRVLYEVQQNPGISSAGIARACFITPQSAQAILVGAVTRGWARRIKSPENDRLVLTELTRTGERLLEHAKEIKSRIDAEVWVGISLADVRQMNATVARALANLEHSKAAESVQSDA